MSQATYVIVTPPISPPGHAAEPHRLALARNDCRLEARADGPVCGAMLHRLEDGRHRLTLSGRIGQGSAPFWTGETDEPAEAPGGTYRQLAFSTYNVDAGCPVVEVEAHDPVAAEDQQDRDVEAAAATERTLARLRILPAVCTSCPEHRGFRTKVSSRCDTADTPCGCRSLLRGRCDRWDVALARDGVLRPEDLTHETPADAVADVVDRHGSNGAPRGWSRWPAVREAMRRLAAAEIGNNSGNEKPTIPAPNRGIVIAAGGPYLAGAYVSLRVLREVGCTLPVELWHLPGEELDGEVLAAIEEAAPGPLRIVDAGVLGFPMRGTGREGGWQLKAFAALHSDFDHLLYLDADAYVARDPAHLFDSPEFLEHGAVFFADKPDPAVTPQPDAWRALGLEPRDEPAFDSGAFLVDRRRHRGSLRLAWWMNRHHSFYYELPGVHGDKDLFHFAWRLLGLDYAMPPATAWEQRWEGHTMIHRGFGGEPEVLHRVRDKWSAARDKRGDRVFKTTEQYASRNVHHGALPHETLAIASITALRSRLAPREAAAEAVVSEAFTADLAGRKLPTKLVMMREGGRVVDLVVRAGGTAELDGSPAWWRVGGDAILLETIAGSTPMWRQADGTWLGQMADDSWCVAVPQ